MRDPSPSKPRPSPSAPGTARPSALTMNVMRLTAPRPSLANAMPFIATVPSDSADADNLPADQLLRNAPSWEGEGAPCGVGSLSVLPSSLGFIYASETFRSFISVFNQASVPVHNVSVSVYVQTSSQRTVSLHDTSQAPRPTLQPRASINKVVKVALPELGIHKLICAASYTDLSANSGHVRTLQQTFSFNVLPPLEPSLSVVTLYKGLDSFQFPSPEPHLTSAFVHYLVDLRVLNAVPVPVYVTGVDFVPKPPFQARALHRTAAHASHLEASTLEESNEQPTIPMRKASMGVGDAQNFLFHVYRPLARLGVENASAGGNIFASSSTSQISRAGLRRTDRTASQSVKHIRATSNISHDHEDITRRSGSGRDVHKSQTVAKQLGHLTISWRSAHGESGHLDNVVSATEPLSRPSDIDVSIYAVPHEIHTQRPFVARCAARNNTSRTVRLYLQVRRDLVGEIVPVGVSGVSLGEVLPGSTAKCSLTLIPLARGQHSISGVRVVDIDTNMSYKANPPVLSIS